MFSTNPLFISTKGPFISTNRGKISTNRGKISTNRGKISTKPPFISTNHSILSTNYGFISTFFAYPDILLYKLIVDISRVNFLLFFRSYDAYMQSVFLSEQQCLSFYTIHKELYF